MNFAGFEKIAKYLAVPLVLGILALILWNRHIDKKTESVQENDRESVLAAYRKAVQLDPDNAAGWKRLVHQPLNFANNSFLFNCL